MRTVTPDSDFYAVLGVSPSASQEQIRTQYRELVRKYHPDLHPGDAHAADMMEKVNAAYDVLGSPEERRQYDERLSASSTVWQEPAGPQTYGRTAANGSGPQSSWNPQWGAAQDQRERQAEAEAMWEAMRSQERSNSGWSFDDVWARVPDTSSSSMSGFAVVGRILWTIIRVVISILFIVLRLLNTRVDDRNDFF
jgi:curved DNA-binding protein CbpA